MDMAIDDGNVVDRGGLGGRAGGRQDCRRRSGKKFSAIARHFGGHHGCCFKPSATPPVLSTRLGQSASHILRGLRSMIEH